ncbi:MAG TPA: DUF362 domain-containing protein [Desulfobacteraceae bacterium]|nr:DUF362 domain-containing protein [Desulfobacteraceae bacterium]
MNRREFLRDVLLWSAGLSLSVPRFTVSAVLAAPDPSPLVAVGTGADYVKLTAAVLEGLGGMGNFVRHGDRVVVKPNIGWDRSPDQAANTHPLVVRAVIDQALAAGASSVQVFDRPCNDPRRSYKNSGIEDMVRPIKDRRVRIEHMDERKFVPVDIARGKAVSRLEIYRDALEADCYINVPVAKHHGLSRLTIGLKNSMGVLGGNRGRMHHDLGQKLADLATVLRPSLNIIDAIRILLRNGPQGGSLADVKTIDTIIASADPVAADAWTTTLFDLEPGDIESTVAAHAMGLGEMNIDKMRLRTVTA